MSKSDIFLLSHLLYFLLEGDKDQEQFVYENRVGWDGMRVRSLCGVKKNNLYLYEHRYDRNKYIEDCKKHAACWQINTQQRLHDILCDIEEDMEGLSVGGGLLQYERSYERMAEFIPQMAALLGIPSIRKRERREENVLCVKRLRPEGILPHLAHESDAAYDIAAAESILLPAKGTTKVKTAIALSIPPSFYGQLASRSSLAAIHKVIVVGGVIDAGYRGELEVILYNTGSREYAVEQGQRIAQLLILPAHHPPIKEVDVLDESDRGTSGFGSTGK